MVLYYNTHLANGHLRRAMALLLPALVPAPSGGGKAKMKPARSGREAERDAASGGAGFPAHPQERPFRRGTECAPATPSMNRRCPTFHFIPNEKSSR
jgi:hypothetical protein